MRILLTNDDGLQAPGIAALFDALEGLGELTVIAPDHNASGVGRAITVTRPLRVSAERFGAGRLGVVCDGTPCDCVRVAMLGALGPPPDLVVSGVNAGPNMGTDVTYSGTVGAALEAALWGRPAVAFSVASREPRELASSAGLLRSLVERVAERGLPSRTILNVNLPDLPLREIAGVRLARLGGSSCWDGLSLIDGVNGKEGAEPREYLAPCGCLAVERPELTDFGVVSGGFVAVTPLSIDPFAAEFFEELPDWGLSLEHLLV